LAPSKICNDHNKEWLAQEGHHVSGSWCCSLVPQFPLSSQSISSGRHVVKRWSEKGEGSLTGAFQLISTAINVAFFELSVQEREYAKFIPLWHSIL
jgi:hypothetical protein